MGRDVRRPVLPRLGCFHLDDRRLRAWDIAYDERYTHVAPQRYRLREFRWSGGRWRLVRSRLTKRRYSPVDPAEPFAVSVADDPLREFGMRWLWWGVAKPVSRPPRRRLDDLPR